MPSALGHVLGFNVVLKRTRRSDDEEQQQSDVNVNASIPQAHPGVASKAGNSCNETFLPKHNQRRVCQSATANYHRCPVCGFSSRFILTALKLTSEMGWDEQDVFRFRLLEDPVH